MIELLQTKKQVIEYIEATRKAIKEGLDLEEVSERYDFIYESIEEMKSKVKPNTIVYLQKELKSALGKYSAFEREQEEDTFIEFFKEAYPEGKRRKSFTWVLTDPNTISNEQVLTTLKYVNKLCLNGCRLTPQEKTDVRRYIQKVLDKREIKYINQIRSLEGIRKGTHIKILGTDQGFEIK